MNNIFTTVRVLQNSANNVTDFIGINIDDFLDTFCKNVTDLEQYLGCDFNCVEIFVTCEIDGVVEITGIKYEDFTNWCEKFV